VGAISSTRRRRSALLCVAALLVANTAMGDGAHMQLTQAAGPFVITLFTAPTPLRSGPVTVSLLVQTRSDRAPVRDATVDIVLRALAPDAHQEITAQAQRGLVPNKLFYSAELVVPTMGRWSIAAHVRDGDRAADVSCVVDVAAAMAPLLAFWGFIALPAVAIGVFALHQWLKASAAASQRAGAAANDRLG
jgi:hypothetical protein